MKRYAIGSALALLLVGCSSKPPQAWMLYGHAAYTYGRIEALAEVACATPPEKMKAVCAEAANVQKEVRALDPIVKAELAKSEPNWDVILKYTDLIIGIAGKLLVVP